MQRKIYGVPGDFLEDNGDLLRRYEAVCQLNIGNAQAHREEPCHPGLLFGRYEEDGVPVLLFGNTLPWNICLNGVPGSEKSVRAAAQLAAWLREEDIAIAGVTCSEELAEEFCKAYGGAFQKGIAMDIMELRQVIDPPAVPGRLRKADENDLEQIIRWDVEFHREALGEEPDPAGCREKVKTRLEAGTVYLWETPEGEPVSMASTTRDMVYGISVNGVYTPPEHRSKGFAQNYVAAVCREKLSSGKEYITLFVDRSNPVSNRVYRKIGFVILENSCSRRLL